MWNDADSRKCAGRSLGDGCNGVVVYRNVLPDGS